MGERIDGCRTVQVIVLTLLNPELPTLSNVTKSMLNVVMEANYLSKVKGSVPLQPLTKPFRRTPPYLSSLM